MNQANFIGRITKDLEPRQSQSGKMVLNNSIAVNRPFKNKQTGEREADFINFVAFDKTAEIINQYHKKGDLIGLSGRMQSRSYENNNGQRVFVTELVVNEMHFTGGNGSNNDPESQNNSNYKNTSNQQYGGSQGVYEPNPFGNSNQQPMDIQDSELPF